MINMVLEDDRTVSDARSAPITTARCYRSRPWPSAPRGRRVIALWLLVLS